jgi:hypothetical protein
MPRQSSFRVVLSKDEHLESITRQYANIRYRIVMLFAPKSSCLPHRAAPMM